MSFIKGEKKTIKIALVGNPNVGKSVVFNYLTSSYVDVSNYAGTTIEISVGNLKLSDTEKLGSNFSFQVIDTPGIYSVSNLQEEETVTRDYILEADLIINVVSALSLGRDLFLTKQLADMGKPMLVLINQYDEARKHKINVKVKVISQALGLDVELSSATLGEGLEELRTYILNFIDNAKFKPGRISKEVDNYCVPYLEMVFDRASALLIAEADAEVAKANDIVLPLNATSRRKEIYNIRNREVDELVKESVSEIQFEWVDKLGDLFLNPVIGSLTAITVVYTFLFLFLGVFVAGTTVDFLENDIFKAYYEPFVRNLVGSILPYDSSSLLGTLFTDPARALGTILVGDYGVLTLTITYLYALLLPLVFGFYLGLAFLEDSGYLPRLAVLVDGVLSGLGMNGRAIIPLILGGGCVTMATVTTRLLSTKKEKLITIALLGLTIPCSAQLGVIQGLLTNIGGFLPWLIWGGTLFIVFILTGLVLNKLVPGECGHFVSDIPPIRLPILKNLMQKTMQRTKVFMNEATPAFFIAALVVGVLQVTGILKYIINWAEPILADVLLLPKEVTLSFILGMIRRDFGAFGLMEIPLNAAQLVTVCVVLTLFVPCIATVAVMIKEKNLKIAMGIWVSSWILALGIGAILARVLPFIL
jgi:ferrous iron transport protein B